MSIPVRGFGLHGGRPAAVRFLRADGPVRIRAGANEAAISDLTADGSARSTVVSAGALRVGTVEHVLAALEARSIRSGIVIEVSGAGELEMPLFDGGARGFADALRLVLDDDASPDPRPVVTREATFEVGASRYVFAPRARVHVAVAIDFDDARIAPSASWDGDADDFRVRIAPARTFGFARELGALLARGLAQHVTPESVIVFADDAVHVAGAPYTADEPARHKLLDLLGDLYLHGGAPLGSLVATRPGHAATHDVMRRAWADGVLAATRV